MEANYSISMHSFLGTFAYFYRLNYIDENKIIFIMFFIGAQRHTVSVLNHTGSDDMDNHQVHFSITKFKEVSGVMVPLNYNHWKPLILYFAAKCTSFQVNCWISDLEAIDSVKPFANHVNVQDNNNKDLSLPFSEALADLFPGWTINISPPGSSVIVSQTGEITNEFINTLTNNCFDQYGRIKWFSINFCLNGKIIFYAEHNGREFHALDVTDNDIAFIRSILPKDVVFSVSV